MRLLLDTHLLVWAMGSPERLPEELQSILEDPAHTPWFSMTRLWELVIKKALNLLKGGWQELPIKAQHALAVGDRPPLQRDPFDRLLLAQANTEALLLITADQELAKYPGPIRWLVPRS